ncbi:MAG: glutamine--fructose-6-phosphate transaminase (isomerizing) [Candidatus Omnitrophica bacterium]|nr:glutamine--fructose-6-phosphate transaminase (isomerizing) [Candidatus Omnitrophota bacterium]
MCGIIGYIGEKEAQPILLNGLKRLEYRGYDSCGMATYLPGKKALSVRKLPGKIKALEELLARKALAGSMGIGHCRWATHGAPNQANAHPHTDCKGEIVLVHNGIIENYLQLKHVLIRRGHKFRSQTDTEVIVHLIEDFYHKLPFEQAVLKALSKLEGSFAIAAISKREPDKIIGARLGSPLVVGAGRGENFLASDIPALLDFAKEVVFLEDGEYAVLTKERAEIFDLAGKPVKRAAVHINWDISQAQKQGWPHFMLKEINEQPRVLNDILGQRIPDAKEGVYFEELRITDEQLKAVNSINIIACGTAYHAGLCGKYILEKLCKRPVGVDLASEFRYRDPLVGADTLVIAISQSGETADTLAAAREARKKGALVLTICNVLGSTLVREADGVIYTHAGPEIGVASTKAYTAQLAILYLFAIYLARILQVAGGGESFVKLLSSLRSCPRLQEKVLENQNTIKKVARRHSHFGSFLFLGRNVNYPSALEGALKLKEVSYIPAEGYAAGEMKHGPIALIDEYRAVVCIAPSSRIYEKMASNIQEIRSRRGKIIVIATEGDEKMKGLTAEVIYTPKVDEFFSPLIMALPLQLLAYHIAVKRGCDVDQPRNLAKSVTVE